MVDPSVLGIPWKKQLWHRWKALRKVPFRKSWFVGYDLEGNSYWELIDHNNPHRLRRKVALDRPYFHFGDFKPHPMWMQWLQFNRPKPPSLTDLVKDAQRIHRMKLLAKQADEKWKSVPLKSSGGSDDPRITSAWSGQPGAKPVEDDVRTSWGDQSAQPQIAQHGDMPNVRLAMEHAESQNKAQPKVTRDALGQVKVEKPTKPKQ